MKLNNLILAPPGEWKYQQPETGYWMKGITFEQLLQKVFQHRSNMKLTPIAEPFSTLAQEIEDWICRQLSPEDQTRLCQTGVRHRKAIGWNEVMNFLESNKQWMKDGGHKEPEKEAERRAKICASCPLNVPVQGCAVCKKTIEEYREKVVQAKPTSVDGQLQACGVCGCDLKSIVHLPLTALRAGKHNKDFENVSWCWQNPNGVNSKQG